jgi:ketosteroid isomerase-like protein
MADHPNVELVRRGYRAFESGDLATLNELFADDIVWHSAGRSQLSGEFKGKQEVFGLFAKLAELTAGSFKQDIHDLLGNDEHVVALVDSTAHRDGKTLSQRGVHVFHIRDGKVTEFWLMSDDQYAADEFFG